MKTQTWRRPSWAQAHFWLSLLVGLQVLIWIGTGAFFALNPIEQVRGAHLRAEPAAALIDWRHMRISPEDAAGAFGASTAEIRLRMVDGRATYLVAGPEGPLGLVDGETGAARPAVTAQEAQRIAEAAFVGAAAVTSVRFYEEGPQEYGREGAVWAVRFGGPEGAVFYVEAATGEVRAVRTDQWRAFDFAWGLHIMDWDGREDINNLGLKVFALLALAFSISGIALTWRGVRRRGRRGGR